MIVLGIDPGSSKAKVSHTGIVLLDGVRLIDSWAVAGGIDGFREWFTSRIYEGFEGYELIVTEDYSSIWIDAVVCEQFVDRQVGGADRSPMLIEGAVRFLWPDVVLSPPSGYKTAVPDDILKKLGLWDFGTRDHHGDRRSAARHAIRFQKNQKVPEVLAVFR